MRGAATVRGAPAGLASLRFASALLIGTGCVALWWFISGSFESHVEACFQRAASSSSSNDPRHLIVAVSDVHVLGASRGWLDVAWSTFGLRASFAAISKACTRAQSLKNHRTTLVVLGDHLDEGVRLSDEAWDRDVARYRRALEPVAAASGINILDSQVGNHDAGMGRSMSTFSLDRFSKSFGEVNSKTTLFAATPHETSFYSVNSLVFGGASAGTPAEASAREFIERVKSERGTPSSDRQQQTQDASPGRRPGVRVLLTHLPLHREHDLSCGADRVAEGGHVTYVSAETPLSSETDVLPLSVTEELIEAVRPRIALSGHLHARCVRDWAYLVQHRYPQRVLEVTVPAFAWRMRPDPGFAIVSVPERREILNEKERTFDEGDLADEDVRAYLCELPTEVTTIVGIVAGGLCLSGGLGLALIAISLSRRKKGNESRFKTT